MDLLKRIQDLSDIYDDDGPSSTVQESRPMFNDGGMLVQPNADGSRPGYAAPRKITVDDDKLIAEWRKQLTKKNPVQWNTFLKNKFGESTREALDSRINRKFKKENINWNPAKEFSTKVNPRQTRYNAVKELVDEHNLSEKFLYNKQDIFKKLNISRLVRKEQPEVFKLFDTMDSREDKIKNAFDKIVNGNQTIYKPKKLRSSSGQKGGLIKQMISDIVSPKKGSLQKISTPLNIQKVLNNYKPYLDIKADFDYLDKFQSSNFVNKNFNEALEYSKYSRGGLDIKGLSEFKGGYGKPEKVIYQFAARHAFLNNKKNTPSEVEFFKLNKKGEPIGKAINFNNLPKDAKTSAKILDTKEYGFKYKDQFFTQNNLKTKGFNSGLFDEVFSLTKKGQTSVPNPNNPSEQITLRKLLQDSGDKLTIGHSDAKGGIAKRPFNNLRIESGKLNLSLYGAYERVKNKELRKLIVDDIANKFPSINLAGDAYEKAFINEQSNIVKNISKQTDSLSPYRGAGQNIIKNLDTELLNKSKPFQKELFRVAGMREKAQKDLFTKLTPKHQQLIKNQFCPGNKVGGPPGSCDISEAMDNMLKQTNAVKQGAIKGTEATRIANKASKVVRFGTGKGLGAVLGPLGIGAEAVFEVAMAVPGYGKGKSGKRLLGDSLLGLIPGVGQSTEEEFAEYATKDGMSQLEQQKIKDVNRFLELNESLPSAQKNIGKGGRGDSLKGAKTFTKQYKEFSPLYNQFVGGPPSESASTAFAEQQRINDLIKADELERARKRNIAMNEDFMAAGGGIAKMAGDRSGPPPQSGPNSQGLQGLFNRAMKIKE